MRETNGERGERDRVYARDNGKETEFMRETKGKRGERWSL